jgi:hypothetical protein
VDFGAMPAIIRTRDGMSKFKELEQKAIEVDSRTNIVKIEGEEHFDGKADLSNDLNDFISQPEEAESDHEGSPMSESSEVGQKRKL